jgi:FAD/FMN-containing dehydrogenase
MPTCATPRRKHALMNRRAFLKAIGSAALLPILPYRLAAADNFRRFHPSDSGWPSKADWKRLNDAVGGNLIRVDFPLSVLSDAPSSEAAQRLSKDITNPFFVRDQPGLTQTLGWVDAWSTQPSVYAVAARNAQDIAAAVNFARQNSLRLVIKGGGHSYQGTSNAPDSLLIWTRNMHDVEMHDAFVPQGCAGVIQPQPAVTVGAGTIGMEAYQAVTTQAGKYVQGGGCTTVCLGGLVQSGGFGSHSKRFGTAASNLLEAEVVTADGQIRIANACTNSDLFWALKGGGGGTFGVLSKMTLRLHDLPEFFGVANFKITAASDDAYRRLIREFVSFYRENLLNEHWGEQAHLRPDNTLEISMLANGLDSNQPKQVWQPFLDWVNRSGGYSLKSPVVLGSLPARHYWDPAWWLKHWPEIAFPGHQILDYMLAHIVSQPTWKFDERAGTPPGNAWWSGDALQVAWFIWGFQSLWMPAALLADDAQSRLADALFAASRYHYFELHFSKGLAGAPPDAIARSKDTSTNPAVLDAFALALAADAQGPAFPRVPGHPPGVAYPGIPGHEPAIKEAHASAALIDKCMSRLRAIVPNGGAYVSESDYFQQDWQQAYWGSNYRQLSEIKKKYDPDGLFIVHNGVGSEHWSKDGFIRL